MGNKRTVEELFIDVIALMDEFSFTENEDRPSNSFFIAELNKAEFFSLRNELAEMLEALY